MFGNLLFGDNAPAQGQAPGQPTPAQPAPQPAAPSFFDKIGTDPAVTNAMLFAGARLLQGQAIGQSGAGLIGDAVAVGTAAHQMTTENQRENALQQAKADRENRVADAQITSVQANTAATQQETKQKAALFPETQKKIALEVRRLAAMGRKEEAMALMEEFKSDPSRIADQYDLDKAATQAAINQRNAAAGASAASARQADATTDFTKQRTAAATALNEEGQPEAVLHGSGKKGAGGARQKMEEWDAYLAPLIPDAMERRKAVADMLDPRKMKGEDMTGLRLLVENGDTGQRKWAMEQIAGKAGYGAGAAPPAAGGKPGASAPKRMRFDANGQPIK